VLQFFFFFMIIAFVTWNANLVPLIEGPCILNLNVLESEELKREIDSPSLSPTELV